MLAAGSPTVTVTVTGTNRSSSPDDAATLDSAGIFNSAT